MKRILLPITLVLLWASIGHSANWFAEADCASANMSTCTWDSQADGAGSNLTWASRSAGDVFYANGRASITVDTDPGVGGSTVKLSNKADNGATGGGTFLISAAITATVDTEAGATTSACLTHSGANATQIGIATSIHTAGSAATSYAVVSTGTGSWVLMGACNAGGNGTAHGCRWAAASGSLAYTGNATGGTSSGATGLVTAGAANATMTGNCTGGSALNTPGCGAQSSGTLTVTGNLIMGTKGASIEGLVVWTPTQGTHYFQTVTGTDVYAGTFSDATKVLPSGTFVHSGTGTSTSGTASGGGGVWGF